MNNQSKDILREYENPDNDYSYGSKKTVYSFFPQYNQKKVDEALLGSKVYTKYKKYRRPSSFLPVYGTRRLILVEEK